MVKPPTTDFYEDDEPVEKIKAVWERGEKGRTAPIFHFEGGQVRPDATGVGVGIATEDMREPVLT